MMRLFKNSMTRRIHPHASTVIKFGDNTFSEATGEAIAGFVGFYIANVLVGTLVISLTDVDLVVALTSVLLTLGNRAWRNRY